MVFDKTELVENEIFKNCETVSSKYLRLGKMNAHMFYMNYYGLYPRRGWSGGAMVLGKLPVPGRPTIWITVGQGPTALAVGAGGGCLDIFTLIYLFSPLSPSLWETARYRLKYCLKGPLNPKQPKIYPRHIKYVVGYTVFVFPSILPSVGGMVGWCDGAG